MAEDAVVEAIIRFKAENLGAITAAKAELETVPGVITSSNARVVRSASEAKAAERDVVSEGGNLARAFGSVGDAGEKAFSRVSAAASSVFAGGGIGLGVGAALVGGGAVAVMAKSMMDNADKNEEAQKGLTQAFETQGETLQSFQPAIDGWISKNSRFIQSEYDAKDAFAAATRAGFDYNTTQRLMNDALDLQAIKGGSLVDQMGSLIRAHSGDARALRDLGVAQKDLEDPTKAIQKAQDEVTKATDANTKAVRTLDEWEAAHSNRAKLTQADLMHEQDLKGKVGKTTDDLKQANQDLAGAQAAAKDTGDKFNQTLDLVEGRAGGAHNKVSDLKQSSNDLRFQWQKLSDENGPALTGMMAGLVGDADSLLNKLRAIGNDDKWWGNLNNGLVNVARALEPVLQGFSALNDFQHRINNFHPSFSVGGIAGGNAIGTVENLFGGFTR